jgi:hypothetical protein
VKIGIVGSAGILRDAIESLAPIQAGPSHATKNNEK